MSDTLSFDDLSRVFTRTTERAALQAWHWIGRGQYDAAITEINREMIDALSMLPVDAKAVYWGEQQDTEIKNGSKVGAEGSGMIVDIVVNPIENRVSMHTSGPGAVSVIGAAPGGTIKDIGAAKYVEMIVVGEHSAEKVDPNLPLEKNLSLVAESLGKTVGELLIYVLDIPQNEDLVAQLCDIGCRVRHRRQGELVGAVCAADGIREVDLYLGHNRAHQALLASVAVNGLRGKLFARCAPQSDEETAAIKDSELYKAGWVCNHDLVASKWTTFCATGVTVNALVNGVELCGDRFETRTMVIGGENAYQRVVHTKHRRIDTQGKTSA